MELKLLVVIALSLGLIAAILGFVAWLIRTSKKEAEHYKGAPKESERWMKWKSRLGWLSFAFFLLLLVTPTQIVAGLFLSVLGAYFSCYGVAVYKAGNLEDLGFGITFYGKAARVVGVMIGLFGAFLLILALGGLALSL